MLKKSVKRVQKSETKIEKNIRTNFLRAVGKLRKNDDLYFLKYIYLQKNNLNTVKGIFFYVI